MHKSLAIIIVLLVERLDVVREVSVHVRLSLDWLLLGHSHSILNVSELLDRLNGLLGVGGEGSGLESAIVTVDQVINGAH